MKKALIVAALLLSACTNESKTKRILENEGFTEIEINGYSFFACGEDDVFATGFCAKNAAGNKVCGTVCGGVGKGYTIRYE